SSAMYTGATTEADPTARPPTKRNATKLVRSTASAQPIEAVRNMRAITKRTLLRPNASVGLPTARAPTIEPNRAVATVNRSSKLLNLKFVCSHPVVPEITAVSKPNKSPQSEATRALRIRYALIGGGG